MWEITPTIGLSSSNKHKKLTVTTFDAYVDKIVERTLLCLQKQKL